MPDQKDLRYSLLANWQGGRRIKNHSHHQRGFKTHGFTVTFKEKPTVATGSIGANTSTILVPIISVILNLQIPFRHSHNLSGGEGSFPKNEVIVFYTLLSLLLHKSPSNHSGGRPAPQKLRC